MSARDPLGTDLQLVFLADGTADLALGASDLTTVDHIDNLRQALLLRLLARRGELRHLGHPDYGSRIDEVFGQNLDRLELTRLERYVHRALMADPRVESITSLRVSPRLDDPSAVDVTATVRAVTGDALSLEAAIDVG